MGQFLWSTIDVRIAGMDRRALHVDDRPMDWLYHTFFLILSLRPRGQQFVLGYFGYCFILLRSDRFAGHIGLFKLRQQT
jgi:hypothetical protein